FREHWKQRGEIALAWFHEWVLHPADALAVWAAEHQAALKARRMAEARNMLTHWAEIPLDDFDRVILGDQLWALSHSTLGYALWQTPAAPRQAILASAIAHYQAALRVYTEADFPQQWAGTQVNLANAYSSLPA